MSKLREYINNNTVIKDEIYKQFESSLCCSICLDIIYFFLLAGAKIISNGEKLKISTELNFVNHVKRIGPKGTILAQIVV